MHIYAIWNIPNSTFLRWGVNGGGEEGYCLYRGHYCFFSTRIAARQAIRDFEKPKDFIVMKFIAAEEIAI